MVFFLIFSFQGIVPVAATCSVKELFVPASRLEAAVAEAGTLPVLEINKVSVVDVWY